MRRTVLFVDLDHTVLRGPLATAVVPFAVREMAEATERPPGTVHELLRAESRERRADPVCPLIRALDWGDIVRTVAARLRVRLSVDPDELARTCAGPPHSRVLGDAGNVLDRLAGPDRFLVAATRGLRKYQIPVLRRLGLLERFDAVLTPEDSGALKNRRAFYGRWPTRARLRVHAGDSYADDVAAPLRFGHRAVWRPRNPKPALDAADPFERASRVPLPEPGSRPDAVVHRLGELPRVVERLEGIGD